MLWRPSSPADTPGVHLHHRVPHMLPPDELKLLHPRRRLAPFSPPSPLDIVTEQQEEGEEGEAAAEQSNWKDRVRAQAGSGLGLQSQGGTSIGSVGCCCLAGCPRHSTA